MESFDYTGRMARTPVPAYTGRMASSRHLKSKADGPSLAVIGGGAAGFFTALNAAEKNPRLRIVIFEAGERPLQKVRISGGGRCNLTHACFDPARLVEFYPRGQRELRSLFARFQPRDTVAWFESRGLTLKTEADGRIFPASDTSQDVIDLFLREAARLGVEVRTRARVESLTHEGGAFQVQVAGKRERFDACMLATGYSPPGWELARRLGHTILPPVPSLFPLTAPSPVIQGLQGIALPHVRGRLLTPAAGKNGKIEAEGAVLITHTGLSGPVIYRLSAWGARVLAENRYQARLQLDFLPTLGEDALREALQALFEGADAKKKLENTHFPPLPQRLWLALLAESGANLEERAEAIGKKTVNRLLERLKRLELPVTGKSPSKEEFVSCGGVALREVDFRTMESRLLPGLYFGGEILDIDGLTGGFNFQACWSAAWTASEAIALL